MSTGFSCHPILESPVRTPVTSEADKHEVQHTVKLKKSPDCRSVNYESNQSGRLTLRVRRPFKYLKHRGPRPIAASSPTFYWNIYNNSIEVHQTSSSQTRILSQNLERYSTQHSIKMERQSSKDNLSYKTNRKSENHYPQSTSRLLRSRKLKLSALNVSNLSSSSNATAAAHSRFEIVNGDATNPFNVNDIDQFKTAGAKRLSLRTPLESMSCFSDGTISAPNSSCHSLTIFESSHRSFPPVTSIEMNKFKRISDGTLVFATDKSSTSHHTRSFSDFGISVNSSMALRKLNR